MSKISFVIPCYRSARTLEGVVAEIRETMQTMKEYEYDIFLINDCSPDDTYEVITALAQKYNNISGVSLAKNFGQHAALMAGLRKADGDIVVCLDDDGQTPADEVGKLIDGIENGSDVVYASYDNKKHSAFRNFGTWMNDIMTRIMLGKPKDLHLTSYFAARRFVVDSMLEYENSYPYIIGLVLRSTRNITNVPVQHRSREVGASGYTMKKLMALWFNGFTAFSILPLRIATITGVTFAVGGFLYGIYTIIKKIVNPAVPMGFSSLMAATVFIGGMLMIMLGLIGEYIGRIYISINNSPQYVIREETDNTPVTIHGMEAAHSNDSGRY
ncbi:MAG: glycosyltransferase family 2 protein [Lachnospiraceae bacterium]